MNSIEKYLLGLILIFLSFSGAEAQYIEVKTELDTNQIRLGEPLHLDISLHQPKNIHVEFPLIQDTVVENLEVVKEWPADTSVVADGLEILKRYTLTSFDSGLYAIPPMKFYFSSDVWTDSLESNPVFMYVHTVAIDSVIYDVKSPLHIPVGFREVFPYVLGGLVILGGVGFLIWYLRRRKKNKPLFSSSKPKDPAHIVAFRELRELKDMNLWQNSEFKEYYSRLTEIIRRYMERRYNITAMELTSYEILEEWKRSGEEKPELTEKLNMLLNLADLVKFAKQKPVASENEENMERAYEFVEQTKWEAPEIEEV